MSSLDKKVLKYTIWGMLIVISIIYFDSILKFLGSVWNVIFPLVLGLCIAYILNMVMKSIEKKFPKLNRGISILLTLLLVVGVLTLMSVLIIPQFIDACSIIKVAVPRYYKNIQEWVSQNSDKLPTIAEQLGQLNVDWDSIFQKIVSFATNNTGTLVSTTVSLIGSFTVGVFNVLVALVFAIYVLSCKEKLYDKLKAVLSSSKYTIIVDRIFHILKTSDKCFSSFVIGQCKEALILGFLCMLGMLIICPKYAIMIGVLIGITAFIPILGAYIGAIIGAFVVFTEEPIKALYFIIFIIVLQQIEGNLIYPKVVGTSVGVPGILVFTAVTIGGGLAGIAGMFLGVPIMAVLYQFFKEYLYKKNANNVSSHDDSSETPQEVSVDTSTQNVVSDDNN
ncbi:MAG: AI-2E family transporter [Ruminococcus sp.]|nr:AI-2E family transporter [Ruminococcus sp.]